MRTPHIGRLVTGALFVGAGALHFIRPAPYESIMPEWIPAHRELVYASGVAEAAGGAALFADGTAKAGGWWLIAVLLGVFPANLNMALHPERYSGIPEALLWARLPLQALMIAWVYRVSVAPSD
jgi:uncharacterized membrane protein